MGTKKKTKTLALAANTVRYKPGRKTQLQPTMVKEPGDHAYDLDHLTDAVLDDAVDQRPIVSGGTPAGIADIPVAPSKATSALPDWAKDQFEVAISNAGKQYVKASPVYTKYVADILAPATFTNALAVGATDTQEAMDDLVRDFLTGLPETLKVDGAYKLVAMATEAVVYAARQIDSLPGSIARAQANNRDYTVQEDLLNRAMLQAVDAAQALDAVKRVYATSLTDDGAKPLSVSWYRAAKASLDSAAYRLSLNLAPPPKKMDDARAATANLFAQRFTKPKEAALKA